MLSVQKQHSAVGARIHRPKIQPQADQPSLDLSVIIVSYNTRDLTLNCLKSVFSQNHISYEVIVVDNSSEDDTVDHIRTCFPRVKLIKNETNKGFAVANNQAIRLAAGRYVLLLNSDTLLISDDSLCKMVAFMDARKDAGISGCKLTKANGKLDWPCKRSFQTPAIFLYRSLRLDKLFPRHPRFGKYHLTYLDENQTHEVDAITGAFLMIRRETIEDIGLLDEHLFMYSEDMDWCFRAKQRQWKVFYYPEVHVIHYKSRSNKKRNHKMMYWWYYSTWYVYKKHMAKRYNKLVNAMVFLGFCAMFLVS
ncbi:MAG: glycosyltransferase family 2 protein, partial [candidate division KSB1 bacterium]|nr:glycosyltransferase family 2 protein [candidate division KSB1 bacterium]